MENNVQNDNQPTRACYNNTPTVTVLSKTLACVFDSEVVAIRSYNARQFAFELPTTACNLKLAPRFHQGKSGRFFAKARHFHSRRFVLCAFANTICNKKGSKKTCFQFCFFLHFFLQLNVTCFCKDLRQFSHHGVGILWQDACCSTCRWLWQRLLYSTWNLMPFV